jgi:UDP-glucose 4-epimerase
MPFISQVAIGKKDIVTIFGDDYPTSDGTCIRDYIHVMDLASGHVSAMKKLETGKMGIKFYNLGTGKGVSVLQLIKTFETVNNVKIPFVIQPRRDGDISTMFADPKLAQDELGWKANHTLEQMCADFWRWQSKNPNGYKTELHTNGH